MAAKPIERFVKKQIADQGGWPRITERLASGETVADIARSLLTPQGQSISRSFLSRLLHDDPERSTAVKAARKEGASAMVDDALHIVDSAPADRDSVNKAKVRAELRVKVAGFIDRESWGEQKQQVNVNVNQFDLHLDALRHRMVEASRPLEQAIAEGQREDFRLLGSGSSSDSSPSDSEGAALHTCGTEVTVSAPVSRQ
jgi:hypothetical protein